MWVCSKCGYQSDYQLNKCPQCGKSDKYFYELSDANPKLSVLEQAKLRALWMQSCTIPMRLCAMAVQLDEENQKQAADSLREKAMLVLNNQGKIAAHLDMGICPDVGVNCLVLKDDIDALDFTQSASLVELENVFAGIKEILKEINESL